MIVPRVVLLLQFLNCVCYEIKSLLSEHDCTFSELGIFSGDQISFKSNSEPILELRVDKAENNYLNSLGKIIQNG